jgi:hypothetical protein
MKLFLSFLLAIWLLSSSCHKSCIETFPIPGYFPLKIGNQWSYVGIQVPERGAQTHKVVGKVISHGFTYFLLKREYQNAYSDTLFLRVDEKIRIWRLVNNQPHIWFDPTLADNATYYFPFGDAEKYNVMVRRNVKVEAINQVFPDCIDFFFNVAQIADEEQAFSLAPGVGIVRIYGAWVDLYLDHYTIQ